MGTYIDLTDQKFGRWKVIQRSGYSGNAKKPYVFWECVCDCGVVRDVQSNCLRSGASRSCGCLQLDYAKTNHNRATHGNSNERLYRVWVGMRQRCSLPTHNRYKRYGGRGIKVCQEWEDYYVFRTWALSNGYDTKALRGGCTIDRINPDGDYTPNNCRWVSAKEQANNRRKRRIQQCK